MSQDLYQQTLSKLTQSLEKKWNTPVQFFNKAYLNGNKKWIQKDNSTIFPLHFNLLSSGHIKVSSILNEEKCANAYDVIQWTLHSLEDIFRKHRVSSYFDSKEIYPLLIESVSDKNSLKLAYEIYEKSSATSFIHCHSKVFKRELFSSNLYQTLIFVSDMAHLSKEDQLFLSHFIRTQSKIPLIVASIQGSFEISKIVSPLLDGFASFRSC